MLPAQMTKSGFYPQCRMLTTVRHELKLPGTAERVAIQQRSLPSSYGSLGEEAPGDRKHFYLNAGRGMDSPFVNAHQMLRRVKIRKAVITTGESEAKIRMPPPQFPPPKFIKKKRGRSCRTGNARLRPTLRPLGYDHHRGGRNKLNFVPFELPKSRCCSPKLSVESIKLLCLPNQDPTQARNKTRRLAKIIAFRQKRREIMKKLMHIWKYTYGVGFVPGSEMRTLINSWSHKLGKISKKTNFSKVILKKLRQALSPSQAQPPKSHPKQTVLESSTVQNIHFPLRSLYRLERYRSWLELYHHHHHSKKPNRPNKKKKLVEIRGKKLVHFGNRKFMIISGKRLVEVPGGKLFRIHQKKLKQVPKRKLIKWVARQRAIIRRRRSFFLLQARKKANLKSLSEAKGTKPVDTTRITKFKLLVKPVRGLKRKRLDVREGNRAQGKRVKLPALKIGNQVVMRSKQITKSKEKTLKLLQAKKLAEIKTKKLTGIRTKQVQPVSMKSPVVKAEKPKLADARRKSLAAIKARKIAELRNKTSAEIKARRKLAAVFQKKLCKLNAKKFQGYKAKYQVLIKARKKEVILNSRRAKLQTIKRVILKAKQMAQKKSKRIAKKKVLELLEKKGARISELQSKKFEELLRVKIEAILVRRIQMIIKSNVQKAVRRKYRTLRKHFRTKKDGRKGKRCSKNTGCQVPSKLAIRKTQDTERVRRKTIKHSKPIKVKPKRSGDFKSKRKDQQGTARKNSKPCVFKHSRLASKLLIDVKIKPRSNQEKPKRKSLSGKKQKLLRPKKSTSVDPAGPMKAEEKSNRSTRAAATIPKQGFVIKPTAAVASTSNSPKELLSGKTREKTEKKIRDHCRRHKSNPDKKISSPRAATMEKTKSSKKDIRTKTSERCSSKSNQRRPDKTIAPKLAAVSSSTTKSISGRKSSSSQDCRVHEASRSQSQESPKVQPKKARGIFSPGAAVPQAKQTLDPVSKSPGVNLKPVPEKNSHKLPMKGISETGKTSHKSRSKKSHERHQRKHAEVEKEEHPRKREPKTSNKRREKSGRHSKGTSDIHPVETSLSKPMDMFGKKFMESSRRKAGDKSDKKDDGKTVGASNKTSMEVSGIKPSEMSGKVPVVNPGKTPAQVSRRKPVGVPSRKPGEILLLESGSVSERKSTVESAKKHRESSSRHLGRISGMKPMETSDRKLLEIRGKSSTFVSAGSAQREAQGRKHAEISEMTRMQATGRKQLEIHGQKVMETAGKKQVEKPRRKSTDGSRRTVGALGPMLTATSTQKSDSSRVRGTKSTKSSKRKSSKSSDRSTSKNSTKKDPESPGKTSRERSGRKSRKSTERPSITPSRSSCGKPAAASDTNKIPRKSEETVDRKATEVPARKSIETPEKMAVYSPRVKPMVSPEKTFMSRSDKMSGRNPAAETRKIPLGLPGKHTILSSVKKEKGLHRSMSIPGKRPAEVPVKTSTSFSVKISVDIPGRTSVQVAERGTYNRKSVVTPRGEPGRRPMVIRREKPVEGPTTKSIGTSKRMVVKNTQRSPEESSGKQQIKLTGEKSSGKFNRIFSKKDKAVGVETPISISERKLRVVATYGKPILTTGRKLVSDGGKHIEVSLRPPAVIPSKHSKDSSERKCKDNSGKKSKDISGSKSKVHSGRKSKDISGRKSKDHSGRKSKDHSGKTSKDLSKRKSKNVPGRKVEETSRKSKKKSELKHAKMNKSVTMTGKMVKKIQEKQSRHKTIHKERKTIPTPGKIEEKTERKSSQMSGKTSLAFDDRKAVLLPKHGILSTMGKKSALKKQRTALEGKRVTIIDLKTPRYHSRGLLSRRKPEESLYRKTLKRLARKHLGKNALFNSSKLLRRRSQSSKPKEQPDKAPSSSVVPTISVRMNVDPLVMHTIELLRYKRELEMSAGGVDSETMSQTLNSLPVIANVSQEELLLENVPLPSQDVKHLLLKRVAVLLAHGGFTHAKLPAAELLTDALNTFLLNLTNRLKQIRERELAGVDHGFPDPMERALVEFGMGGVRGIEEFYQTKVADYHRRMEDQCKYLQKQFTSVDQAKKAPSAPETQPTTSSDTWTEM